MVSVECFRAFRDQNHLPGPDNLRGSASALLWRLHRLDRLAQRASSGLCPGLGHDNEGKLLIDSPPCFVCVTHCAMTGWC